MKYDTDSMPESEIRKGIINELEYQVKITPDLTKEALSERLIATSEFIPEMFKQIEKLEEALGVYADDESWILYDFGIMQKWVTHVGSDVAKKALESKP